MREHPTVIKSRAVLVGMMAALGFAACGDDNSGGVRTVTVPAESSAQETSTSATTDGEAILIRTYVPDAKTHAGEVREFLIGERVVCRGGKTSGGSDGPTITTTFHCPDGTLKVRFAPTQPSLVQGAPWDVVAGTGSFEGLRGGGSMVAKFEDHGSHPSNGREFFTGTVAK
jgi:hypothetical protein